MAHIWDVISNDINKNRKSNCMKIRITKQIIKCANEI
jgi:hypothetical protein